MNRTTIPRSPSGSNNEARRFIDTHDILHPARRPMPQSVRPIPAGGALEIKNYDKIKSWAKGRSLVWVATGNTVVVDGVDDPNNPGTNIKSEPGLYLCTQSTGPKVVSGTTIYQIPLVVMPNPDDIEDPLNYWTLIQPFFDCAT